MSLIVALSLIIFQVTSHSCRSDPVARTFSSEDNSEEFEQSNRNIADLLLPLLDHVSHEKDSRKNILEVLPYEDFDDHPKRRKKNWDDMKQLVEIAPLRRKKQIKGRNPPLAIILSTSNVPDLNPNIKRIKRIEEKMYKSKKRHEDERNESYDSDELEAESHSKEKEDSEKSHDRKSDGSANIDVKKGSDEKTNDSASYAYESVNQEDLNKQVAYVLKSTNSNYIVEANTNDNTRAEGKYKNNNSILEEKESKYDETKANYELIKEPELNEDKSDETKNDSSNDSLSESQDDNDTTDTNSKGIESSSIESSEVKKSAPLEEEREESKDSDGDTIHFAVGNILNETDVLIEVSEPSNSINADLSLDYRKENGLSKVDHNVEKSADVTEKIHKDDINEKLVTHNSIEVINSSENEKSGSSCLDSRTANNAKEEQENSPHKSYTLSFLFNK